MKRLLTATVLSIAALTLAAGQAPAWFLTHHCCKQCCVSVCCKQYNAFSPVCCGNITCYGCSPSLNFGQGCCGAGDAVAGWDGGGYLGQLPAAAPVITTTPGATTIPFQAPMPTPATTAPMGYYGAMMPAWPMVQPVGYGPAYLPMMAGYGR